MTLDEKYYLYLRQRSRLGLLYRRYWLYPRLNRHLRGQTLDVGCGIGDFLAYRPGTVGADINPATVEWCRHQGLNAHLMAADVLDFADGSFDSATLDNVLEHLTAPVPLLRDIYRVLRLHGALVVGVPGQYGYTVDPDHKIFYDEALLVSTLDAAGFALQQIFHTPWRSNWLNLHMRQYCIYGVFQRV
jgi:SAM-dependent methyltransferase